VNRIKNTKDGEFTLLFSLYFKFMNSFKHTKDASIWNKPLHRLKADFKIVMFHMGDDKSGNDKSTKVQRSCL